MMSLEPNERAPGDLPHLYGDDEDVKGIWLFRCGQGLPLALQLGHLHPLAAEERMLTLQVTDSHQQHVAMAVLDRLIVDTAQVVSSQQALQESDTSFSIRQNVGKSNNISG